MEHVSFFLRKRNRETETKIVSSFLETETEYVFPFQKQK